MSTCSRLLGLGLILLATPLLAAQSPALGMPASEQDIEAIDLTVMVDGSGLPPGQGTAGGGETVYREHCLACHGPAGVDGINDRLAGGRGSLGSAQPVMTLGSYWPYATTVFDYVRRAMPYRQPGSLSDDQVYAVTAYLLFINGIVERDQLLDAHTLPAVEMPNADGFTWAYP